MNCTCQTIDWFIHDRGWVYTADCEIHHHEDTEPGGIKPAEIEREAENENTMV
jgi:hypothetical protein